MSDYTTNTWVTGGTFNAGSANAWEGRINTAFTSHETTMAGQGTNITGAQTDIAALQVLSTTLPVSASSPVADSYTLVMADAGTSVGNNTNSNAKTITIPLNASVAFPAGTVIEIRNAGTGTITLSVSGITLRSRGGILTITQQWATARLYKTSTNTWWFNGEIG